MSKYQLQSGQSLIEILFAIAIFTVGVLTIGYLTIDAQVSLQRNIEFSQARLLAYEGIEAVRTIRNSDFNNLSAGTYGLTLSGAVWGLEEGEPDQTSKFIRTIEIEDISPKIKHVTSFVVWSGIGQIERNVSFESYVTSWTQEASDADSIVISSDQATTSSNGEEVLELTIENTGSDEITLTEMVGVWNNINTIQAITIGGTEVFAVSTSSPQGEVSGATVDIVDYLFMPEVGSVDIDSIMFDGSMVGATLTLSFVFSDQSSKEVNLSF